MLYLFFQTKEITMKRIRVFVYCVTQIYCFALYAADDCSDLRKYDLKKCTSEPITRVVENDKKNKISPRKLEIKLDGIRAEIESQKNNPDTIVLQKLETSRLAIEFQLSEVRRSGCGNSPIVQELPRESVAGEGKKPKRRRSIIEYMAERQDEGGSTGTRMNAYEQRPRSDSPRPGEKLERVASFEGVKSKISREQKD